MRRNSVLFLMSFFACPVAGCVDEKDDLCERASLGASQIDLAVKHARMKGIEPKNVDVLVAEEVIEATALVDPWGSDYRLVDGRAISAGCDGKLGTADDVTSRSSPGVCRGRCK